MSEDARLHWTPALGGKVSSLRFGAAGREWLAAPVRPPAAPAPGQDWAELDCSGWDECFPNIAAAPAEGLQDHGDVWRVPWTTQGTDPLAGSVAPQGRTYRFGRAPAVHGSTLRIDYRLDNLGERPLAWAWAQHMLLAAHERMRVVASSPMRLRVDSAYRDGERDDAAFDDLVGRPVTEIALGGTVGRAAKLWLEPPLPAVVGVVDDAASDGAGEWLAWRVADSTAPQLGLWINLGGWGDLPLAHVAVEPAFGASDDPVRAYARSKPLGAGERTGWRVVVEAGTGAPGELPGPWPR